MANARGKCEDKTHLSIDVAEERMIQHRDYIAHCFRWSHVIKWAIKQRKLGLKVLDIGCGKEVPLARALYTNKIGAERYVGIDLNRLEVPEMLTGKKFPITLIKGDAAVLTEQDIGMRPNLITAFEIAEHIEIDHWCRVAENLCTLLADDGVFFVSTPVFNGKAAGNHVNEMYHDVFGATLEDAGFTVEKHYGTFASIVDYRPQLQARFGNIGLTIFDQLRDYYDTNVLSVIFAPLFPEHSRNCIWRCRKKRPEDDRQFAPLTEQPRPWGSSEVNHV